VVQTDQVGERVAVEHAGGDREEDLGEVAGEVAAGEEIQQRVAALAVEAGDGLVEEEEARSRAALLG
jgi:hypothetical protein